MRHMNLEEQEGDFAAAAAAAGIQSGDAPAAPMSAPTAATSGTNAANARATSRLSWATAIAPAPAFPTTWQGSKEPGQCELVLYALLWLHSVALQSPTVVDAARAKRRNKQDRGQQRWRVGLEIGGITKSCVYGEDTSLESLGRARRAYFALLRATSVGLSCQTGSSVVLIIVCIFGQRRPLQVALQQFHVARAHRRALCRRPRRATSPAAANELVQGLLLQATLQHVLVEAAARHDAVDVARLGLASSPHPCHHLVVIVRVPVGVE